MARPLTATANATRGIGAPPWLTGALRGLLEAAVMAGLVGAGAYVAGTDAPPELQAFAPLLLWIMRTLEGLADQIDPSKQRADSSRDETDDGDEEDE